MTITVNIIVAYPYSCLNNCKTRPNLHDVIKAWFNINEITDASVFALFSTKLLWICNLLGCGFVFLFNKFVFLGSNYYVRILSTIDRELLKPNASVALHKHSNALVDVLPPEADSSIMMLTSGKHSALLYACCDV